MHEATESHSPKINNSITTDSCPQSPSSFENLAPVKSNYLHPMNVYHPNHYSAMNF